MAPVVPALSVKVLPTPETVLSVMLPPPVLIVELPDRFTGPVAEKAPPPVVTVPARPTGPA